MQTRSIHKILLSVFLLFHADLFAQKYLADSLGKELAKERTDTGRVRLMWQMANATNNFDPTAALSISKQALFLATKINDIEGQSRSMGILANTFIRFGNYPKALELLLSKLKLEEKRNNPYSLASVHMNIGVVYTYQEEYSKALLYYSKADSVISGNNIEKLKFYSFENLGDIYDRLNNTDSAFTYFNKALVQASNDKDKNVLIGAPLTGLGHTYRKQGNYPFSMINYHAAITYLQAANDNDILCEATLGLSKLFLKLNQADSVTYYAKRSLAIAKADGLLPRELDATELLTEHYKNVKNVDSAFVYLNKLQQLNDTINSKTRIRESQVMSSNEQLRQIEIDENRKAAIKERKQQLQYLFIGIFIPGFFLLTLLLSRIRVHTRVIRILGILSLLILFEYLTLLLHPTVAALTNHTPVYEMFIFVSLATLLIPAHHRIEGWLIKKLTHRKDGSIKLKKVKLTVKAPPEEAE